MSVFDQRFLFAGFRFDVCLFVCLVMVFSSVFCWSQTIACGS